MIPKYQIGDKIEIPWGPKTKIVPIVEIKTYFHIEVIAYIVETCPGHKKWIYEKDIIDNKANKAHNHW